MPALLSSLSFASNLLFTPPIFVDSVSVKTTSLMLGSLDDEQLSSNIDNEFKQYAENRPLISPKIVEETANPKTTKKLQHHKKAESKKTMRVTVHTIKKPHHYHTKVAMLNDVKPIVTSTELAQNTVSPPHAQQEITTPEEPKKIEFTVNKFITNGELPISEDDAADYFKELEGKSYDLTALQSVAQGLEKRIRDKGFAFYRVLLPTQSVESGEIHLNVVAFNLENINVTGNDIFSKESIIESLPELTQGISPNTKELADAIKVSNKHPSRQLQLTFAQHENAEKVDATIKVSEQPRPYKFSLSLNNSGSDSSGEYRLMGGFQHSNLWGMEHIMNLSYTLPPDHADTIKQYGGTYALPIYSLGGWLNMSYASSSTNNGMVATDLTITGAGEMMGLHYQQYLPKIEKYEHSLDIGLDSKYFINDVQFKKTQLGNNVRSLPLSISYKAEYPIDEIRTGYFVQWSMNTGLWSDNTDESYRKSRYGANSSWNLVRYGTNLSTHFDQWILSTSLSGQYTKKPLIAGEQVGIGGSSDIRGYEQRETSADNGQIVKVELTSPEWEKINAFVFYDYGHGAKEKPLAGEIKDWNLSSTGIGTKVAWQENFNASLTFATALNDANTTKTFNNRLLLNVSMQY